MLLLSPIALLVIGGFVIHSFAGEFGETDIPKLDQNLFTVGDRINDYDANDANWEGVAADLLDDGYQLYVAKGSDTLYSNLNHYPKSVTVFLRNVNWTETARSFYMAGTAIVGKTAGGYTVVAVNGGNHENMNAMQRDQFAIVLKAFVMIGLIAIAMILIVSQFFTSWLVKRIMRPINALTEGANRIVHGNLSEPVTYDGKDELASVCSTFNQMQSYLQEERERNASYEKARTDMIAGISHDLRTPLTSVKGYIKGLRDGVANTQEKQEQYLSIAYSKASEMDVLLQKLFYFSKLETGSLPLSLDNEDMGDFVYRFALQSQEELAQVNAQIIVDCRTIDNPVQIDTEQMHRVLANLTENALKYAGADRLCISIL